jgi:2-aminoadipate transaminase
MQPQFVGVASDAEGLDPEALRQAGPARMLYLLPNFQNPTGRSMSAERRVQIAQAAEATGVPIVEDNPYGDLWFDEPPPAPITGLNPERAIYMGSFSKTLAPGLRLGFLVAPKTIYPKLLQAKQAADLHTPSFNQRMVAEVLKDGFLDQHVPKIRALYKAQRDAMLQALRTHMPSGVSWNEPSGGMFLWVKLPQHLNATTLLPKAVERNVAFVPGAPFYAQSPETHTLRLSFVTPTVEQIHAGIEQLANTIKDALA